MRTREMIGEYISHYRILEKLGEGGMGVVYLAEDTRLRRQVALKFLPPSSLATEEDRRRFEQEARAAARLNHPNICTIHAFDEHEARLFLVMERLDGETLRERLLASPLSIDEALDYAAQIADALNAAHQAGIVHRDVKPGNIMVSDGGRVKVMDFGLARAVDRSLLTREGTTLGTAAYMSPEQARGGEVDSRTDIWSFGVVLFEMLTGERPFTSVYDSALIYAILHEDPRPLSVSRPDIPPALEGIVRTCLEKEPAQRYQNVGEIAAELHSLEHDESEPSRTGEQTPPINRPPERPPARRRRIAYLAVPLVLVLLVGIYLYLPDRAGAVGLDHSIAVMPFDNLSPNSEDAFFADGITEDVINSLSKIADLRVISRRTSMRYKDTDKPLRTIGGELNVATILEGSVRRFGDDLRISVQLIDVERDHTLWAENYDRRLEDVFAIQSEVARQVATALEAQLTPDEFYRIDTPPTDNLAAYELYLMGLERWDFNREAQKEAAELYQMAISLDPQFALAKAHLAHTYNFLHQGERALEMAHRALEIDSTEAFAHWALGVRQWGDGQFSEARASFRRSVAYDPNFTWPMSDLATLETRVGRLDEALRWARLALEREPDDANTFFHVASPLIVLEVDDLTERLLTLALEKEPLFEGPKPYPRIPRRLAQWEATRGNYDAATRWLEEAMELHPDNYELPHSYTSVLFMAGAPEAALHIEDLYNQGPHRPAYYLPATYRTLYAWVLLQRNDDSAAAALLEESLTRSLVQLEDGSENPRLAAHASAVHALLGETAEALTWLERAYGMGYVRPRVLEQAPLFDSIRHDERFRNLIDRMRSDIAEMRARADLSWVPGASG